MQNPRVGEGAGKVFSHPPGRAAERLPTPPSNLSNASRLVSRVCRSAFLKRFFRTLRSRAVASSVFFAGARPMPTARKAFRPLKLFP
jgi:hypothetical protein